MFEMRVVVKFPPEINLKTANALVKSRLHNPCCHHNFICAVYCKTSGNVMFLKCSCDTE